MFIITRDYPLCMIKWYMFIITRDYPLCIIKWYIHIYNYQGLPLVAGGGVHESRWPTGRAQRLQTFHASPEAAGHLVPGCWWHGLPSNRTVSVSHGVCIVLGTVAGGGGEVVFPYSLAVLVRIHILPLLWCGQYLAQLFYFKFHKIWPKLLKKCEWNKWQAMNLEPSDY